MKKVFSIFFSLMILLSLLTACDNTKIANNGENNNQTTSNNENSEKDSTATKIVNDDGEEFTVDIANNGEVKDNAEAIGSNKITINGKSYDFPIRVSTLMSDGWSLPSGGSFENEFAPNTNTNLVSFYLKLEDGTELNLTQIYNDSAEVKGIEDCLLTGIKVYGYSVNADAFDFVLPGGATMKSTAADIISVFGDPNNNANFESGYNLDEQLTYEKHKESNISYSFSFNEDGTIYSVTVELQD